MTNSGWSSNRSQLPSAAGAPPGLDPDIGLQATAPDAVADLAGRGLGVAILSATMARGFPALTAIPITGVGTPAVLALVWRPAESPATRQLVEHCRHAFGPPTHFK